MDRENEGRWPRRKQRQNKGNPSKVFFFRLGRVQGPHPMMLIGHRNTSRVCIYVFVLVGVAFTGTVLKVKGMFLKEATRCCTMK